MTVPCATTVVLTRAAAGRMSAREARPVLLGHLGAPGGAPEVYACLVGRTWRSIQEGRKDPDLREWHRLMRDLAAECDRSGETEHAIRIKALSDLVRVSVGMSDGTPVEALLKDEVYRRVLDSVVSAGSAGRHVEEIDVELGLRPGSVDRALGQLAFHGLVCRNASGAFMATGERGGLAQTGAQAPRGSDIAPAQGADPSRTSAA